MTFNQDERLQPFVLFCVVISSLGALNNGFNTSVLNIPAKALTHCPNVPFGEVTYYPHSLLPQCIPMSDWIYGTATGIFAIGGLFGAMISGSMSQRWGRRDAMIMMNIPFFVGAILLSTSIEAVQFAIGRIFVGIGCGALNVVISMYIAEISPPKYRGALGSVLQLSLTVGVLLIEVIGLGLSTAIGWRIVVAMTIVPAMIQMVCLPFCARSPRWLISQNRYDEASVQLARLRYGDVEEEFTSMVFGGDTDKMTVTPVVECPQETNTSFFDDKTLAPPKEEHVFSIQDIFSHRVLRTLTFKMMIVHAASQLTGINAVMYYSTQIFQASFGENAKYVAIGTAAQNVVMTLVGLALVDRLGRKMLLTFSSFGMCFWTIIMTVALHYQIPLLQVVSIYLYVLCNSIGLGMIPFVLTAEVYPTYAVSAASSVALAINWLCKFIIGLLFPALQTQCGPYVFLIFAGISFLVGWFVIFFIPETKQKSLEELGQALGWAGIHPNKTMITK